MHIAMFSSKPYDRLFFDALNRGHEIRYLEPHLNIRPAWRRAAK